MTNTSVNALKTALLEFIEQEKSLVISKEDVCKLLNIQPPTYKDYVRQGKVPYTKVGQKVIHPRKMFEDWFNNLPDFRHGRTA